MPHVLTNDEFETYLSDFRIFDKNNDGHLDRSECASLFTSQLEREPTDKEASVALLVEKLGLLDHRHNYYCYC